MTLTILSARLTYSGPDWLDVTRAHVDRCRKTGKPEPIGAAFAPSWSILGPALEARKAAADLRYQARVATLEMAGSQRTLPITYDGMVDTFKLYAEADAIEACAWEVYVPAFIAEMRISAGMTPKSERWSSAEDIAWLAKVRPNRKAWQWLLSQERVVLCCACTDRNRCHTLILRRDILPKFGAVDGGEVNNGTK